MHLSIIGRPRYGNLIYVPDVYYAFWTIIVYGAKIKQLLPVPLTHSLKRFEPNILSHTVQLDLDLCLVYAHSTILILSNLL